jgi:hypothetical protein
VSSTVIVDTNVPLVANRRSPMAGDACVAACSHVLLDITRGRKRIALDDKWRILSEYGHKLSRTGQPGVGDAFYKWVLTNQANRALCDRVEIHPLADDAEDFEEFPRHQPGLEAFDRADRKFVAVSAAHPDRPPILQAVDLKWWSWNPALRAAGIEVEFLCPAEVGVMTVQERPSAAERWQRSRRA